MCHDSDIERRVYGEIDAEYRRACRQIMDVAGIAELLADSPFLKRSLERRDSYLDPLNHIQFALLRRYRDGDLRGADRDIWLVPLLRSINAISTGLRNTG